jgi:lipoprotein NlpI
MLRSGWVLLLFGMFASCLAEGFTPADQQALREQLQRQREELDRQLQANPQQLELLSRRGDCLFFLGEFAAAVADYDAMLVLDPGQENSHWRRGIALFYAGKYAAGAEQFEKYHSFDQVDRENGIWRYFCQWKAAGKARAQAELLRYEKDDREPFPDVYRLFSGELTAEEVLDRVRSRERAPQQQQASEFYANLYVGLNAALDGETAVARTHLQAATDNPWPRQAGYGPRYMWHVGRLHRQLLEQQAAAGQGAEQAISPLE